jgi:hypothetical protein
MDVKKMTVQVSTGFKGLRTATSDGRRRIQGLSFDFYKRRKI